MPSRGICVPCAGPWHRFAGLHGRPFAEPHRATPRRSPVALPLSSPRPRNPIALTDDALAAVRRGRNDVVGTVPFAPQTHLHRFHDDDESPRPAARDSSIPPTLDVSPGASLVAQTSPHTGIPTVRLKARFPPRTSAARTVASPTVTLPYAPAPRSVARRHIAPCTAAVHSTPKLPHAPRSMRNTEHRTCPPTFPPVSTPSRAPPRGLSAIPPMHDAAASIIACSRRRRLGRARNGQRPSYRPPRENIAMGTAPQGQVHAQVRRGPPRNNIYIVANMGVAKGSHAARMRAGAIRGEGEG
ncbi:hypothetical protein B0H14DRAFT_3496713 [Mycena olivaceomarginata]|nr:hypothetical protein B0H14DRAFT_3496713 [Mycena olivaceomarginata]